jgi:hypothetical protein
MYEIFWRQILKNNWRKGNKYKVLNRNLHHSRQQSLQNNVKWVTDIQWKAGNIWMCVIYLLISGKLSNNSTISHKHSGNTENSIIVYCSIVNSLCIFYSYTSLLDHSITAQKTDHTAMRTSNSTIYIIFQCDLEFRYCQHYDYYFTKILTQVIIPSQVFMKQSNLKFIKAFPNIFKVPEMEW